MVLSYSYSAGDRKQGAVLRLYRSFGSAKECFKSRMASWEERCWSLSPILLNMAVFSLRRSVMEVTSPIEDPNKVAHDRSITLALGREDKMLLAISGEPIISVFPAFSISPIEEPTRSTTCTSWRKFSSLPPRVPSSRWKKDNSERSCKPMCCCMHKQKRRAPKGLPTERLPRIQGSCLPRTVMMVMSTLSGGKGRDSGHDPILLLGPYPCGWN